MFLFFSLDLFEAPITGCFYLLDEESKLPEPTSAHFTNEVFSKDKGHVKLKVRMNLVMNLLAYTYIYSYSFLFSLHRY